MKYTEENLPSCTPDDILLLWDGSRAGVCGFNHTAILSSTVMSLTVRDKKSIYPKYIYYLIQLNKDKITGGRTGSAIPHLSRQVVEELELWIPEDIEKQKQLAELLSAYDNMINTQNQLMKVVEREREQLQYQLLVDWYQR